MNRSHFSYEKHIELESQSCGLGESFTQDIDSSVLFLATAYIRLVSAS